MPKVRLDKLTLDDVNRVVLSISTEIQRVSEQLAHLRSGALSFTGDIDLGGFRVANAGTTQSDDDALTRGELLQRLDELEDEASIFETSAAEGIPGGGRQKRLRRRTSRLKDLIDDTVANTIGDLGFPAVVFTQDDGSGNAELATDTANLIWNNSTKRLGIRKAPTAGLLHIAGNIHLDDSVQPSLNLQSNAGAMRQFQLITDGSTVFWKNLTDNLGTLVVRNSSNVDMFAVSYAAPSLALSIGATSGVINDSGADYDFRVEGVGQANLIRTDAALARVGILTATPSNTFSVGATSQFQVGTDGDLDRIKDVPYAWPVANASGVLTNNGSGTLSWTPAPGASAADHIDIASDELNGGEPTSIFSLSNIPIYGTDILCANGARLRRVGSSPGLNEYTITGSEVTLGFTKAASDFLVADYRVQPNTRRIVNEQLVGTGTSFALSSTPDVGTEVLTRNTIRLRRVGASPGTNEYTISGASITLGIAVVAGEYLVADYDVTQSPVSHTHVYGEELTGTGTSFALANTPVVGSEVLWFNTIRQRRVVAAPSTNEYTISGASITTGMSKAAGDALVADYIY